MNVIIVVCAWSEIKNTFRTLYSEKWRPITKMVLAYIAEPSHQNKLSHGICPSCMARVEWEIAFEERRLGFISKEET